MTRLVRSALFKREVVDVAVRYRAKAGAAIALKFVDQVDDCIRFIATKPQACAVYTRIGGREFRKWRLRDFPVSVFFRLEGRELIILEALYAHRMNIASRLPDETS